MSNRTEAAEAYARAMRTGEFPAVEEADKAMADDIKLNGATVWGKQGATVEGKKDVLYRISGVWPNTPVYRRGYWGFPQEEGDKVKIHATFPAMGAAPAALNLTFSFNSAGKISVVDQEIVPQPRPEVAGLHSGPRQGRHRHGAGERHALLRRLRGRGRHAEPIDARQRPDLQPH